MASSIIPSSPPFFLICSPNPLSNPKPPSFFLLSNNPAFRLPTKISASSSQSQRQPSPPESSDSDVTDETDPSKLAFAKAKEYKKNQSAARLVAQNAAGAEERKNDGGGDDGVPLSAKLSMEKARDYEMNKGLAGVGGNAAEKQTVSGSQEMNLGNLRDAVDEKEEEMKISSIDFSGLDFSEKKTVGMSAGLVTPADPFPDGDFPEVEIIVGDTSKFGDGAASKPKLTKEDDGSQQYKPKISSWGDSARTSENPKMNAAGIEEGKNNSNGDVPFSVKLAMEKSREYKKNKGLTVGGGNAPEKQTILGSQEMKSGSQKDSAIEKKGVLNFSSIDFLGLDFSDKKKTRGMPAGLITPVDPFPDGEIPEVEIVIGDTSKFGDETASIPNPTKEDDGSELYKPKVSSWGVFPRPSNISRTFGGGRNIRPGEALESAEEKAAKEVRTKKLLAAYKNKLSSSIDPKIKRECEKALDEGNSLMDIGRLKEALPYFEKVMKDVDYRNELHGQAALQWSICQDSLCRPNEARPMYEKLQSHPNAQVSKKARHLAFSFQAMEMMKVTTSSSPPSTTGYQDYFEAFLGDRSDYSPTNEENESLLIQVLPYAIFLLSPIFVVLLAASRKLY